MTWSFLLLSRRVRACVCVAVFPFSTPCDAIALSLLSAEANTSYMVTFSTLEVLKRELGRAAHIVSNLLKQPVAHHTHPLRRVQSSPNQHATSPAHNSWESLFTLASTAPCPPRSWVLRISLYSSVEGTSPVDVNDEQFHYWVTFIESTFAKLCRDLQHGLT